MIRRPFLTLIVVCNFLGLALAKAEDKGYKIPDARTAMWTQLKAA